MAVYFSLRATQDAGTNTSLLPSQTTRILNSLIIGGAEQVKLLLQKPGSQH